jgi:predicted DNA-binding transcriptional regulator YafY
MSLIPREDRPRDIEGPGTPLSSGRAQLPRLLELIMAIQSDRYPNARALAERCEVSRRTIFRDLDTLAAAGIPVHYRPDRQGYQLARGCSLPASSLDETELLALLIMARQWKGGAAFDLIRHARSGTQKLIQALPADVRDRLLIRAEPIPEGGPEAPLPRDRRLVYDALLNALALRLQIRIWYRDVRDETGTQETTKLSLYRLVLARGTWYVVGRSTFHRGVRVFRIPWIERATPTTDSYTIPPRFNLERFLGSAWCMERGEVRYGIWLRFSAQAAPEIRGALWHHSQRLAELPDRRADLHLVIDGLDEILGWVLGFGDQVEVLAPPELRERIAALAARVAEIHRARPTRTPPSEDA